MPTSVGFSTKGFPKRSACRLVYLLATAASALSLMPFQQARARDKKRKVTSVTKSNAQGYGMIVWDTAFKRVAAKYPDIETEFVACGCSMYGFRAETRGL